MKSDIKKFLIRNSIITYACLAIALFSMVFAFYIMRKSVDESRKYLYVVRTDGEIVPMEWINRRDNISAEMKHHLTIFTENFYTLNQFNWESRIEKALWLGDFEQLNIRRINDGYYNRFIQYGISQEAVLFPENIEIEQGERNEIVFRIIIKVVEKYDKTEMKYSLLCRGRLKITDRNFPYNPHGAYITDYVEEQAIRE